MLRLTEQDKDNPYSVDERVMQISMALAREGFDTTQYTIITVPNITHITYGRDVGYTIEQEHFDREIEDISATKIRNNS